MKDPEEIMMWIIAAFSCLLGLLIVAFLTAGLVDVVQDRAARRECRSSGHAVSYNEHNDWQCVAPSAERAP